MGVFNLTINTTPDQDTVLADLAASIKSNPQTVLQAQIALLLNGLVAGQIQADLQKLQADSLTTLETLATQSPQSIQVP